MKLKFLANYIALEITENNSFLIGNADYKDDPQKLTIERTLELDHIISLSHIYQHIIKGRSYEKAPINYKNKL